MPLFLQAEAVPLRMDENGVIRIGQTRVLLELVIEAYQGGTTPETIVRWFDSLRLADVYAVISYYLNHKEEVDEYLRGRRTGRAGPAHHRVRAAKPAGIPRRTAGPPRPNGASRGTGERPSALAASIFEEASEQIQKGGGIPHDQFWRDVEESRRAKRSPASRGKKQ